MYTGEEVEESHVLYNSKENGRAGAGGVGEERHSSKLGPRVFFFRTHYIRSSKNIRTTAAILDVIDRDAR